MANRARGEAGIEIGGKTFVLALNLGALAAIEAEFNADSYEEVFADVLSSEKVSAGKMKRLLTAIFDGNGIEDDAGRIDTLMPHDLARIGLDLLTLAFPEETGKGRKATAKNP